MSAAAEPVALLDAFLLPAASWCARRELHSPDPDFFLPFPPKNPGKREVMRGEGGQGHETKRKNQGALTAFPAQDFVRMLHAAPEKHALPSAQHLQPVY